MRTVNMAAFLATCAERCAAFMVCAVLVAALAAA